MATGDMMNIFSEQVSENQENNEFINVTGHTEELDEDLEDMTYSLLALFSEDNIVEEDMFQVKIENDIYQSSDPIDVNNIIKEFKALEDTTTLMMSSVKNADEESVVQVVEKVEGERTSKNAIEATVGIIGAVNEFGHYIKQGSRCPICGKHIDYLPGNGYCSLKCAGKALATKITECITGNYEVDTPKIIDKIRNIMNYFNLVFNVISKFPDILSSFAKLPEEYKEYATAKLNLVFLDLKKIINFLLIQKNRLIIYLLEKINFEAFDEDVASLFSVINTILKTGEALREKVEKALEIAYKSITKTSRMFYIGPQEYGFFMTLKSNQCICPFIKTDALTYPPDQLGMPFWGSGVMNIAFDMSKCQFTPDIGGKSAIRNIDQKKIFKAIRKIFKNISTPEYLMDPDLFDVRLALSDQNSSAIQKLVRMLETIMVIGGDFLPEYDNLKLTNIWFIVAILTCWGPWTKAIYGDFIYHGWL